MRVAILGHTRHPVAPPFAGGLETFTWQLADGLRRQGAHVVLYAPDGTDTAVADEFCPFPQLEVTEAARSDSSMTTEEQVWDNYTNLWAMRELARRDDIDLVHNHSLHALPLIMSTELAVPMVTTLHTPPTPWLEPALRLVPGAATVAVSGAVAEWWAHVTAARVIHNGVDLDQWPLGGGGPNLVWSGRITPEKAPHLAVQIAREAGFGLRIAGPVSDARYYQEELLPVLGDGITYVGHLLPDALARLIGQSAAALVTPSWEEPFGLVAAEAMACGTPVVAFARGGLGEVVALPGGVAVPAEPPESAVSAAAEAVARAVQLDRREVRGHVARHFDIRQTVAAHLAYYEELR